MTTTTADHDDDLSMPPGGAPTAAPDISEGCEPAPAAPPLPAPAQSALRAPQFMRYLGGQTISQIGDQVWFVALAWTAVHLGSPGVAGLLMTVSSAPRIALLLLGGVVADRFDIRRLMMTSDSLCGLIVLAAAGIALARPSIPLLACVAFCYGLASALFMPASSAMQPRLLRAEQYASGAAASGLLGRLALTLGAPLGGVLVAVGGLPLSLTVDAATFAVSVMTLATVRPRPLAEGPATDKRTTASQYLRDFRVGARFLARHPVLRPVTAMIFLSNLGFVGPMNIGLAELSASRGWGGAGVGLMLSGLGIGAAGSTLLLLRWKIRSRPGVWMAVCGVVSGASIFAPAICHSLGYAVAATVVTGLAIGPSSVAASVLIQQHTPDELRGRIGSFNLLFGYGTVPIASVGTGLGIAALGFTGTYAVCGGIEAAAVLFLFVPGLRRAVIVS